MDEIEGRGSVNVLKEGFQVSFDDAARQIGTPVVTVSQKSGMLIVKGSSTSQEEAGRESLDAAGSWMRLGETPRVLEMLGGHVSTHTACPLYGSGDRPASPPYILPCSHGRRCRPDALSASGLEMHRLMGSFIRDRP